MNRKTPFALAAMAALLLSACGSDDPGTATPTATSASSTSASSSASSSAASSTSSASSATSTSEETSDESTTESTDESSSDSGLDADTEAFFTTFCGTVNEVGDAFTNFDPTAEIDSTSPETIRDSLAEAFRPFADEMTSAGETLAAETAPSFDGGDQVQADIVAAFTDAGTSLDEKIDTFAATPADQVQTAATTFQTDITTVFTDFQTQLTAVDADVPADVETAISELPDCAGF